MGISTCKGTVMRVDTDMIADADRDKDYAELLKVASSSARSLQTPNRHRSESRFESFPIGSSDNIKELPPNESVWLARKFQQCRPCRLLTSTLRFNST